MSNRMRIDENIGEAGFSGLGTRYLGSREGITGWPRGSGGNMVLKKSREYYEHHFRGVSFDGILAEEE